MAWRWTPARRRGVEILDDSSTPRDVRERAMTDISRANRLFGGTQSVTAVVRRLLPDLPRDVVLVDVGTGLADIPLALRQSVPGTRLTIVGYDVSVDLLRRATPRLDAAVAGDALRLPFRDRSGDLVLCSQLLHHFVADDARRLIAELHRVARGWVVISDLHRSWIAAAAFWFASVALGFHPVTRRDGFTSVLRGFTPGELASLVHEATGVEPEIRRGVFWRLSAAWRVT